MTKKIVRLTESDLEKIVRRVIKESMGVAFGGEQNGLKIKKMESNEQMEQPGITGGAPVDKKQIYNSDIAKINEFLPVDTTQFKPIFALIKTPGASNMQAFKQYQDVIQQVQNTVLPKINPQGAKERETSNSERYTSVTGLGSVAQNYKAALNLALQDITNIKMGLNYLAGVKAGIMIPKPSWMKSNTELELIKGLGKQVGIA
jgi:hypothetical protein